MTESMWKGYAGMGMRTSGAPAVVALTLTLALATACGGAEQAAPDPAPTTASPAPSETPTEAPEPEPSAEPLSRFEDQSPVQASREWAAKTARAVNRDDRDMTSVAPLLTTHGQQVLPGLAAEDVGLYYPGAIPFTPTSVEQKGRTARVVGCFWVEGFALKRKGGLPAKDRLVIPALLRLEKEGGRWRFDDFFDHDHSCTNVPVKGVGW